MISRLGTTGRDGLPRTRTVSASLRACATVTVASMIAVTGTAAVQATMPDAATASGGSEVRSPAPEPGPPTVLSQQPIGGGGIAFGAVITPQTPLRSGGTGTFLVSLPRHDSGGVAAKRLRLNITATRGAGVKVKAKGWSCRGGKCTRPAVKAGAAAGSALVTVSARSAKSIKVSAKASWKAKSAKKYVTQRTASSVTADVSPALSMRLTGPSGPVTAGADEAIRTVLLKAALAGVDGMNATVSWRQICAGGCRKGSRVSWLSPRKSTISGGQSNATIVLPMIRSKQVLRFRATAQSNGVSVRKTVKVTAVKEGKTSLDPKLDRLAKVRKSQPVGSGFSRAKHKHLVMSRKRVSAQISGKGIRVAAPRSKVTLTLRKKYPRSPVKRVKWGVVSGPKNLLQTKSGQSTSFRMPASGPRVIVEAKVRLANGVNFSRVKIVESRTASRTASRLLAADEVVGAVAGRVSPVARHSAVALCALAKSITDGQAVIQVAGGDTITLNNGIVNGDCQTGGSISTANATLKFGVHTFSVNASITSKGLAIRSGAYIPPAAWVTAVNQQLTAAGITIDSGKLAAALQIRVPAGVAVGSALRPDGTWGPLRGQLKIPAMNFLPLPLGWNASGGMIGFAPTTSELSFRQTFLSPAGEGGVVEIEGSFDKAGNANLSVTISNLTVFKNELGGEVSGSGSGDLSIAVTAGGVKLDGHVSVGIANFSPFKNFHVANTKFAVSFSGMTASMDATLDYGQNADGGTRSVQLKVDLAYQSISQWKASLSVKDDAPWEVADGLQIKNLTGLVEVKPLDDLLVIDFHIRGNANNWSPIDGLTVHKVDAELTNMCPIKRVIACDPRDISLFLDVDAEISAGGTPVAWKATANFNLRTLQFYLAGGASGLKFGPDELNLSDVQLMATNAALTQETCDYASNRTEERAGVTLYFAAKGSVNGEPARFTGRLDPGGYCLWAEVAHLALGVDGLALRNSVVAYSSRRATLTLGDASTLTLAANELAIKSELTLPTALAEMNGVFAGTVAFNGRFNFGNSFGVTGTVSYRLGNDTIIAGTADTNYVSLGGEVIGGLDFRANTAARLTLSANGTLKIRGSGNSALSDSTTTMDVSIGVDLLHMGATIGAGVDASQMPGKVIRNAFGVPGFDIRNLYLAGTLGKGFALSVAADVSLPDTWLSAIKVVPGAPLGLAFQIASGADNCAKLFIGAPDRTEPAIDIANQGILSSRYAEIAFSPVGCRIPLPGGTSLAIDAGVSLAFDGQVGAMPIKFAGSMTLPADGIAPQFTFRGEGTIPAASFPGLFSSSPIRVVADVDTAAYKYAFSVSGAKLNILGSTLNVDDFTFKPSPDSITFTAKASGSLKIVGIPLNDASITIDFSQSLSTGAIDKLTTAGSFNVGIWGAQVWFTGDLNFSNSVFNSFSMQNRLLLDVGITKVDATTTLAYAALPARTSFSCRVQGSYTWFGTVVPFNETIFDI